MTTKVTDKKLTEKLSEIVLDAWQTGHGGNPEEVHLVTSDDSLALMIPKAMYQAEIVLFKNTVTNTRVLDQYLRSLLETIAEDLKPLIEEYSAKTVQQIVPLIDLKAGWIIAFYRFHEREGKSHLV
jgi:hypothetical protein